MSAVHHQMPKENLHLLCQQEGEKLRALASARGRGELTEAEFVENVLRLEAECLRPHGVSLCASNTIDDWTVFKLRVPGSTETCAVLEFLPETGEFRQPGSHD